jgi:hypothetical protein
MCPEKKKGKFTANYDSNISLIEKYLTKMEDLLMNKYRVAQTGRLLSVGPDYSKFMQDGDFMDLDDRLSKLLYFAGLEGIDVSKYETKHEELLKKIDSPNSKNLVEEVEEDDLEYLEPSDRSLRKIAASHNRRQ